MKQVLTFSHARKSCDGKLVLEDVMLAFLPGAKVGVVGPNGMGKSTLLRMMAGLEQPSDGEVRLMPGYSVGILQQEPVRVEDKTVLGNVMEGVSENQGPHRTVRRGRGHAGRRQLRRPARGARAAAGAAGPPGSLGPGQPGRPGDGRPALHPRRPRR